MRVRRRSNPKLIQRRQRSHRELITDIVIYDLPSNSLPKLRKAFRNIAEDDKYWDTLAKYSQTLAYTMQLRKELL